MGVPEKDIPTLSEDIRTLSELDKNIRICKVRTKLYILIGSYGELAAIRVIVSKYRTKFK